LSFIVAAADVGISPTCDALTEQAATAFAAKQWSSAVHFALEGLQAIEEHSTSSSNSTTTGTTSSSSRTEDISSSSCPWIAPHHHLAASTHVSLEDVCAQLRMMAAEAYQHLGQLDQAVQVSATAGG
jgi:hypothetical protein